jgi:pyruvate/2-oxoglutarate/acetoin dehydrogenase E1 component
MRAERQDMIMKYFDELQKAMTWLSIKSDTLFIGQAVEVPGVFMHNTLMHVPEDQRIEFPVCESFQMQFSLGLSLAGYCPITIFPRLNFLILATADMVNMVDKVPAISKGKLNPRMIIRSAIGPDAPVHPGFQHVGDYTEQLGQMFETIQTIRLDHAEDILGAYQEAYYNYGVTLLVEDGRLYNT